MSFTFRKAARENVNVLIGLAGSSGSGKTFSALRMARGLIGPTEPFALIDTEAGRASHYVGVKPEGGAVIEFDKTDFGPPFEPLRYLDAIKATEASGYRVIVIDSISHLQAGEGGILEMHEAELQRMAGDDYKRREACKMAAWVRPKGDNKRFVSHLLQRKAHLIFCFRAEQKIEMAREGGKTVIRPKQSLVGIDGWIPVCEKGLPYELTASFLLMADRPGVPLPVKLPENLRPFFPLDRVIDESSGVKLAAWAAGATRPKAEPDEQKAEPQSEQPAGSAAPDPVDLFRDKIQSADDRRALDEIGEAIRLQSSKFSNSELTSLRVSMARKMKSLAAGQTTTNLGG